MLTNFAVYIKHGFGFTKAFRFAFGITVRDFLINAGLILVIVGLLTTLAIGVMDMLADTQAQHTTEQAAYKKTVETILTACLSDATGRPVVIDGEIYLCGIVPTGARL